METPTLGEPSPPIQLSPVPSGNVGQDNGSLLGRGTAPLHPLPGSAISLAEFAQGVRLVSVDPARNRARVYRLAWQPDLRGSGVLIRAWGRIGASGRLLCIAYPDRASAQPAIQRLLARRLRHGYRPTDWL